MVVKDGQLRQEHLGRVSSFREGINHQHSEMINKYVKEVNEDKIEGEIIKQRAAEER